MTNKSIFIVGLLAFWLVGCTSIPKYMSKEEYKALGDGLYAHMETTKGNMLIKLFPEQTPMTVANFVGLAEGTKTNKSKPAGTPFYDGLIFHRVIKDFMIQGGDPNGTGMGGPGYKFEDEFNVDLNHTKKGLLSMANSGPNTNGSQFFITEIATPWLDGKHTVFGEVIEGLAVIDTIAKVEKGAQDKPLEDIKINHLDIIRKGDAYKDYDANKAFDSAKANHATFVENYKKSVVAKKEAEKQKALEEQREAAARNSDLTKKATFTESGLGYVILEEGAGANPANGENLDVHYTLRLADGEKVDSSYDRKQPLNLVVGKTQLIEGWMEALTMFPKGSKVFLIIPPSLGYGDKGAGGVIPANATLYFDMEVL